MNVFRGDAVSEAVLCRRRREAANVNGRRWKDAANGATWRAAMRCRRALFDDLLGVYGT